ncbi:MAG: hypothetical protein HQK53_20360 [Oligoflexia bacterium]|nr:hypothetical protein [Oligoflexia bacterium]
MIPKLAINETVELLKHWRETKKSKQSRIPIDLWKKVMALRSQYSDDEIIKKLELNSYRFKKKIATLPKKQRNLPDQQKKIKFKEIRPEIPTAFDGSQFKTQGGFGGKIMELNLPNGIIVRFYQ